MKLQSEAKTIVHAHDPPYSPMRARGADPFDRSLTGPERSHTLTRVKPVLGRDAPFGGLRQIPKSITLVCRRHCRFTSDLSPRAAARARKELQTIVNMPGSISSALSARWFYWQLEGFTRSLGRGGIDEQKQHNPGFSNCP